MVQEARTTDLALILPAPAPRSRRGLIWKRKGDAGLSGPAEKCVPTDGGTKWSQNFGWLQERAKDMIHLSPDEMLQVDRCLDRPLGVRGPLPWSGACSNRVTDTEVTESHSGRKPAHKRARDVSETVTIRVV